MVHLHETLPPQAAQESLEAAVKRRSTYSGAGPTSALPASPPPPLSPVHSAFAPVRRLIVQPTLVRLLRGITLHAIGRYGLAPAIT